MKISKRAFLKSMFTSAVVLIIPDALSIEAPKNSYQPAAFKAKSKLIGLKSTYNSQTEQYWIGTNAIKRDGSNYHDLLQVDAIMLQGKTKQEKAAKIAKYLDMILERAEVEGRPTQNQVIESFGYNGGNHLDGKVN